MGDYLRGPGCTDCRDTGFCGRTGIYELLVLDEELRAEIQSHRGTGELRKLARDRGMVTLAGDGVRHIRDGVTTPEEMMRVTRA